MKKLLFIILSFLFTFSYAQQGLQMDLGEVDTLEANLDRQIEYYQLIHGTPENNLFSEGFKLPEINLQQEMIKRYTVDMNFLPAEQFIYTGLNSDAFGIISPFYNNGTILSSQAVQLNDKLVIGGYSYGANSIFSAPLPNQHSSYFDTYGSTMFMQYKVSKNFKIETRVSVGQRQGPPGF